MFLGFFNQSRGCVLNMFLIYNWLFKKKSGSLWMFLGFHDKFRLAVLINLVLKKKKKCSSCKMSTSNLSLPLSFFQMDRWIGRLVAYYKRRLAQRTNIWWGSVISQAVTIICFLIITDIFSELTWHPDLGRKLRGGLDCLKV